MWLLFLPGMRVADGARLQSLGNGRLSSLGSPKMDSWKRGSISDFSLNLAPVLGGFSFSFDPKACLLSALTPDGTSLQLPQLGGQGRHCRVILLCQWLNLSA